MISIQSRNIVQQGPVTTEAPAHAGPSCAQDSWEPAAPAPQHPTAALSEFLPNPDDAVRALKHLHAGAQDAPSEQYLFEGMVSRAVKQSDAQRLTLFMRLGLRTPYLFHSAVSKILPALKDLEPHACVALWTELLAGIHNRDRLSTFTTYARHMLQKHPDRALAATLRAQLEERYELLAPGLQEQLARCLDPSSDWTGMPYKPGIRESLRDGWAALRRPLRRLRAARAVPQLLAKGLAAPDVKTRDEHYAHALRKIRHYALDTLLPDLLGVLTREPDAATVVRLCGRVPLVWLKQPELGVPFTLLGLQRLAECDWGLKSNFLIGLSYEMDDLPEDRADLTTALLQSMLAQGKYPDSMMFNLLGKSGCFDAYAATLPWPDPFGRVESRPWICASSK